jgi:lactate dehydrogenase-like 2-hydroxyacid dehydrogenase
MTTTKRKKPALLLANRFHPETVALLDAQYDTYKLWEAGSPQDQAQLITRVAPYCEAAATSSWLHCPSIYALPNLKIISCFGVGTDGIDFDTTRARNIIVTNTPSVLDDAVADLGIGLILAATRKLVQADNYLRAGHWLESPFPFTAGLAGKTLGIIGLGAIGSEIAKRALPFKMNIAYHSRTSKPVSYTYYDSIAALASNSDVLISVLPGGQETNRIINADIFKALGPQGYFINLGRGSSIDEHDLIKALQNNTIAGAGLDVYDNEPNVPQELIEQDNVVLFPHIGSATVETRRAMGKLVIDNLAAYFGGLNPLTPV